MGRYKNTLVKTDKNTGYRVYGITLYPEIPIQDGDEFIYPFDGEKLDGLAFKYYQDTSLWWIIAQANGLSNGSLSVEPGKQIRIPQNLQKIFGDLEFLNKKR